MAFEHLQAQNTGRTARTAQDDDLYDVGLRQHMLGIYNCMLAGLALSGMVAMVLVQTGLFTLFFNEPGQFTMLGWAAVLAPVGLLLAASVAGERLSVSAAHSLYWGIAALQGVSFALLFQAYTGQSFAHIFFVTAAAFGALSLYGYTTERALSGMASFLIMGLIGVVIVSVVNLFIQSSMLQIVGSAVGVLVFAGLTAYDTQRLKEEYVEGRQGDALAKAQIWGALSLYLNFINLFQLLLSLFGRRDGE